MRLERLGNFTIKERLGSCCSWVFSLGCFIRVEKELGRESKERATGGEGWSFSGLRLFCLKFFFLSKEQEKGEEKVAVSLLPP